MNPPCIELTNHNEAWQGRFAFQIFHRAPEEWVRMRWGFNAAALIEEALDRNRLFVESQSISDSEFRERIPLERTLALRGVKRPGAGLQMGILGRVSTSGKQEARKAALGYAREIFSVFPTDFCLVAAESEDQYRQLCGTDLLAGEFGVAQIRRGRAFLPSEHNYQYLTGLWQASSRSNEQIWRALSAMPCAALFSAMLQPAALYDAERQSLLQVKNAISNSSQNPGLSAAYVSWAEEYVKRRLAPWRKFFLLQVHVVSQGELDQNLARSIGSALTRDSSDFLLPGYQIVEAQSNMERQEWREKIRSLEISPAALRIDDLVDLDEAFAVLRIPYYPEMGIPGADFIQRNVELPPRSAGEPSQLPDANYPR